MNSYSDAEIVNEIPIKSATFSHALYSLETVKTYLMKQDVNDSVFSSLHEVQKRTFLSQESKEFSKIYSTLF